MIKEMGKLCAWTAAAAFCLQMGAAVAAEIPVGVELPLTGHFAKQGLGQLRGIKIAVQAFNQASGGKDTIKLITIDNVGRPIETGAVPYADVCTGDVKALCDKAGIKAP